MAFVIDEFGQVVKKAQALVSERAVVVQKELAAAEYEGFSADETVRVVVSGNQEPRGCDITEAAMETRLTWGKKLLKKAKARDRLAGLRGAGVSPWRGRPGRRRPASRSRAPSRSSARCAM